MQVSKFYLDIPDIFQGLPLALDEQTISRHVAQFVLELMPNEHEEEQRRRAEILYQVAIAVQREDLLYAGICAVQEGGKVGVAGLSVASEQLDVRDSDIAVNGLIEIFAQQRKSAREVRSVDLPVGRAAAMVEERVLNSDMAAEEEGEEVRIRSMQIYIPQAEYNRVVVLAMSTPSLNDWESYCRIFGNIANSIRFADTEEESPELL